MKPRLQRPEAGNPYYNTPSKGGYAVGIIEGNPVDSGCNVLSNCVGYAAGRFNEIIGAGSFRYYTYAPDAHYFIESAHMQGLMTGDTPKLGAIAVWGGGGKHVAIVEQIQSDGSIITSESGYGCKNPFWTMHRYKGGGNWGADAKYKFLGFVYNPATERGIVMRYGDSGENIKKLQTALIRFGYLPAGQADGIFGKYTLSAVCGFQLQHALTVDGIAGAMTVKALGIQI